MNTFMLIFAHIYEYHLRIYSKSETIGRKGMKYVRLLIYINRLFSQVSQKFLKDYLMVLDHIVKHMRRINIIIS